MLKKFGLLFGGKTESAVLIFSLLYTTQSANRPFLLGTHRFAMHSSPGRQIASFVGATLFEQKGFDGFQNGGFIF